MRMLSSDSLLAMFAWLLLIGEISLASANHVYIGQNAVGAANGADCADAYGAALFNASRNWGPAANQIGPGTTVHLCGTITTALTARGSGVSGNPITILFDSASHGRISMPAIPSTGAIVLKKLSHITVDGSRTGVIQSTDNGSPRSLCPSSNYANDLISVGILADGASFITVKNLTIGPLYVHVCTADDTTNHSALRAPGPVAIRNYYGSHDFTISNNTIHDGGWLINGGGNNFRVSGNNLYNMDHGVGVGAAANLGSQTNLYFYGNSIHDAAAWDTDDNSFHHDGIHLFAYCADGSSFCAGNSISNVFIFNNHIYGSWPQNTTGALFFEGNVRNVYVFNNYLDGSNFHYRYFLCEVQGTRVAVYNNTLVGYSAGDSNPSLFALGGLNSTTENNVFTTSNQLIGGGGPFYGNPSTITTLAHNLYANGGGNSFVWCPSGVSCRFWSRSEFSNWVSASGEASSAYLSSPGLNSDGMLASDSPAIGLGENLHAICNGQANPGLGALCYDIAGNRRPASGNWDAGAYNYSAVAPAPPSGRRATVR